MVEVSGHCVYYTSRPMPKFVIGGMESPSPSVALRYCKRPQRLEVGPGYEANEHQCTEWPLAVLQAVGCCALLEGLSMAGEPRRLQPINSAQTKNDMHVVQA